MLFAYLAAAIVGVVLLGVSLVGGDSHEGGGGDGHHDGDGDTALGIFSVRTFTYLLGFGGLCGVLLRLLTTTGEPWTALVSLGVGAVSATGARVLLKRAALPGHSGTVGPRELIGRAGEVLIPFAKGVTGRIRLRVKDADVDLLATTDEDGELSAKEEILVIDVKEGCAQVARNPAAVKRLEEKNR